MANEPPGIPVTGPPGSVGVVGPGGTGSIVPNDPASKFTVVEGPEPRKSYTFDETLHLQRFLVFCILAVLSLIAMVGYWCLVQKNPDFAKEFASVAVAPLVTILASAAGFYFGSKST